MSRPKSLPWIIGLAVMFVAIGQISVAQESPRKQYDSRVVLLSDLEAASDADWKRVDRALELVNSLKPDIVLVAGDVTHQGTADEYARMKKLLATINAPVHVVPGRRDTRVAADQKEARMPIKERHKLKISRFREHFGESNWSIEFGDYQIVGFDSTQVTTPDWPNLSQENDALLRKTFGESSKPYKICLTHLAPEALGSASGVLTSAGVTGHLYGYTHRVRAGRDPLSGRSVFNCGSATQPLHGEYSDLEKQDHGVMVFDVYGSVWVCFWRPLRGNPRPLGVFNMVKAPGKPK
jgi:predicted phosphodiesterase